MFLSRVWKNFGTHHRKSLDRLEKTVGRNICVLVRAHFNLTHEGPVAI